MNKRTAIIVFVVLLVVLLGTYLVDQLNNAPRKAAGDQPYSGIPTNTWFGADKPEKTNSLFATNPTAETGLFEKLESNQSQQVAPSESATSTNADAANPTGIGRYRGGGGQPPTQAVSPESPTVNVSNAPVTPTGQDRVYSGP